VGEGEPEVLGSVAEDDGERGERGGLKKAVDRSRGSIVYENI